MASSGELNRSSFPDGFVFGTASSAYQYEGATNTGGKGPCMWDKFIQEHPERVFGHTNADVAVDFYHRYKEDVERMKELGMDAFRFSISWPRLLPHGKLGAGINEEGIKFYNDLINELIANGIQPYVTLFHWETPQALEDEYGGFLSSNIVSDFRDFAELCFQNFGDRVKHWITINELWIFCTFGYDSGELAPGRCRALVSSSSEPNKKMASAADVYMVGHHMLLAHAIAVKVYKEKYQAAQGGKIGMAAVSHWFEPYSNSEADRTAAQRSLDFMLGWSLEPLIKGEYPQTMVDNIIGLPKFTSKESKMVKGSYDFIGLNHYTTQYATHVDRHDPTKVGYMTDARANWSGERNGILIGERAGGSTWLYIYPEGIYHLLNYIKDTYRNLPIYIFENGVSELDNHSSPLEDALDDSARIKFHESYLQNVLRSIKSDLFSEHGVDVRCYFIWSLLDNFEWTRGYATRFGLYYIDYKNNLKRHAKKSVEWFKQFLKQD